MNTDQGSRPTSLRAILGSGNFRVTRRPDPLPVDLRMSWRVGIILLSLAASRANRASREKLLLLNYAMRNPDSQDSFVDVLSGRQSPFFLQVRVDPGLGRALDFAVGLGLVKWVGGKRVQLTETGLRFADALDGDEAIMAAEKRLLARTRKLATESRVREILRWR